MDPQILLTRPKYKTPTLLCQTEPDTIDPRSDKIRRESGRLVRRGEKRLHPEPPADLPRFGSHAGGGDAK